VNGLSAAKPISLARPSSARQFGRIVENLALFFSDSIFLEVLNMSFGYEGWNIGVSGLLVIATGGGELAIFTNKGQR
jgi:hypothetical protein